mmetsp:Transcript_115087/g.264336  ORF Transcript_115087/g.264336 Transcript_115087/m.264336 type:complete len:83 (-) Transcript_115087:13-261(-)
MVSGCARWTWLLAWRRLRRYWTCCAEGFVGLGNWRWLRNALHALTLAAPEAKIFLFTIRIVVGYHVGLVAQLVASATGAVYA